MTRAIRLVAVTAGLSQPSTSRMLADRLLDATSAALRGNGGAVGTHGIETAGIKTGVVELREHAADITANLLTGFASADLATVKARVSAADALVVVSPIFSASYSGLFKSFFDVLDPDALAGRPLVIGATGGSARHSLALEHALRPLFSYLRAVVAPTAVYAASPDWASPGELSGRIDRAAAELARQVRPGLAERPDAGTDKPDGDLIPFSRLLAAQRSAAALQQP